MPMMMKPVLSLICNALVMWVVCVAPNVMPCLSCRLSVASAVPEVATRMVNATWASPCAGTYTVSKREVTICMELVNDETFTVTG